MADWNRIRQDFPCAENLTYFISAGMSPLPQPVFESVIKEYRRLRDEGDINWEKDLENFLSISQKLAELINTSKENITIVPNTATGMSHIGLSLSRHHPAPFNIVSLEDEFPSSTIGMEYLGITMHYVQPDDGRYSVDNILQKTDSNTAAVVASYVQYATGFRLDPAALGKELRKRNILFILNATQAFPFYPVDVQKMGISAMTVSLHKWGMTGLVGSMFFTSPEFRKKYPAVWTGWLGIKSGSESFIHTAKNAPFELLQDARMYEPGTFNIHLLPALGRALNYLEDIGFDVIRKRIKELTDYLIEGLQKRSIRIVSPIDFPGERSPILLFTLGNKNEECLRKLKEKRIFVSSRIGHIRVSINIFNNFKDIDRLLEALEEI